MQAHMHACVRTYVHGHCIGTGRPADGAGAHHACMHARAHTCMHERMYVHMHAGTRRVSPEDQEATRAALLDEKGMVLVVSPQVSYLLMVTYLWSWW